MTTNWGPPRAGDWCALAIALGDDDGLDVYVSTPAGDAANGTSFRNLQPCRDLPGIGCAAAAA